ncbi:phospholipase D family protein [Noviherbaspirillum soli]|uniref:phospholipase D family protein n=1 Tax=Noviherbaspirillum soli TaxID=1064518 RepID=UPI00188B1667|nr:phospholipase D family protein [Noviherbaspirillum soli]
MFLESKEAVLAMLQHLTESQPVAQPLRIAVAFWGTGAETVIDGNKKYQIICNLLRGGTNPEVIRALRAMPNVEVRHLSGLHAKVVLTDTRAIVGSANFSMDGLGFKSGAGTGWIEAAAVIDSAGVENWFNSHWKASLQVSDEALAQAAELWSKRAPPSPKEAEQAPQLMELDLFKPEITGGNKIRMATRSIETIYFQEIEPESKRSVWNPAYAASLLWTTAGNRIRTRIDGCPYFERPADVLARAKYPKTIDKVHRFVDILSKYPGVSPAIRYWANQYLLDAT